MSNNSETSFKAGFIAVVGRPNVKGKSTLRECLTRRKGQYCEPKGQYDKNSDPRHPQW